MAAMSISGSIWEFQPNAKSSGPALPLRSQGSFCHGKGGTQRIYAAVDQKYAIWLGLRKEENMVVLDMFEIQEAFDVVYNFNILEWAKFMEMFPKEMYSKYKTKKRDE